MATQNNKNNFHESISVWVRAALAGAAIIALVAVAVAACRWSRSIPPAQTIVVSADGLAAIKPDIATISFAVVSEGSSPAVLQKDNNQKVAAAIAYVKNAGIDAKDIKTTGYSLSPKYRYDQKTGRSSIDGYQLTQTVIITVRNLENTGVILGALPELGINQISGPDFSVEDADIFLNEARAEAFAKARAKAQGLARIAGVRLGRVVTFSESHGGYPPVPLYAKAMDGMGGAVESAPVEPGSEEIRVSVSVTFEIR